MGEVDTVELDQMVARIGAAAVLTLEGESTRLRELWRDSPSVTSFVRHFGCLFCHEMVADIVRAVPEIHARGAHVVIVGNGSVNQARHFFERKGLPQDGVSVVTDPERESYKAASFQRGLARTFLNRGSHRAFARASGVGHSITGWFGDLTQLGGVLVVRPPANPTYFHRSTFAGDHPDMAEVVAAIPA